MRPLRLWQVWEPTYNIDVILAVGSRDDVAEEIRNRFDLELPPKGTVSAATTWHLKHGHDTVFIWLREFDRSPSHLGTLAHECVHAVKTLQEIAGVKGHDEETLAYGVGGLFARCNALLNKGGGTALKKTKKKGGKKKGC